MRYWMTAALIVAAASGVSAAAAQEGKKGEKDCEDTEVRLAALQALQAMKSDKLMPTLKTLFERKDSCSAVLRRQALQYVKTYNFTGRQTMDPAGREIVIIAATTDPDDAVRRTAIQMLSGDESDEAVAALGKALNSTQNREIQQIALHAISARRVPGLRKAVRDFAIQEGLSEDMRGQAIQMLSWVAEPNQPMNDRDRKAREKSKEDVKVILTESAGYLREIYPKFKEARYRQQIISSLGQFGGKENMTFLINIAASDDDIETRRAALSRAMGAHYGYGYGYPAGERDKEGPLGIMRATPQELANLYDRVKDESLRQQLIGYYGSQKDDPSFDKLVSIAKSDKSLDSRQAAVNALSRSQHPKAKQALAEIVIR